MLLSKALTINIFPLEDCIKNIEVPSNSFCSFIDFKLGTNIFELFQNLIDIPINDIEEDFQLELIDLHANDGLKTI